MAPYASALIVICVASIAFAAWVFSETARVAQKNSPAQMDLSRLRAGFERVGADFSRLGSARTPEEFNAIETRTGESVAEIEAAAAELAKFQATEDGQSVSQVKDLYRTLESAAREALTARQRVAAAGPQLGANLQTLTASTGSLSELLAKGQRATRFAGIAQQTASLGEAAKSANLSVATLQGALAKQAEAEDAIHKALDEINRMSAIEAEKSKTADTSLAGQLSHLASVARTGLITLATVAAAGLGLAWFFSRRARAAILAWEKRFRAFAGRLRSNLADYTNNAASLRECSRRIAAAGDSLIEKIHSLSHSGADLQTNAHAVGESITRGAGISARAEELAASASQAVDRLNKSSKNIAGLSGKIRAVSFRTNLLALNAAIEAAHAGEAGLGFAVVATEVKGLATNSADLTNEIDACTSQIGEDVANLIESVHGIQAVLCEIGDAQTGLAGLSQTNALAASAVCGAISETAALSAGNNDSALQRLASRFAESVDRLLASGPAA